MNSSEVRVRRGVSNEERMQLARAGREYLEEVNNPELAIRRGRLRALDYFLRNGMSPMQAIDKVEEIELASKPSVYEAKSTSAVEETLTNLFGLDRRTP